MENQGLIYLIPTTLGENTASRSIPEYNLEVINKLDEFIVEELKTARRFLRSIGYTKSFDDEVTFHLLNEHTDKNENFEDFLKSVKTGKNIGLLSEAGCPCVADPGSLIVEIAQSKNIRVVPLVGPSSILLSLMASGFNGQNFAFLGYLPIDKTARVKKIKEIEKSIYQNNQTQIFIEAPYRNNHLFADIISNCDGETKLCVAAELTLPSEFIKTKSINLWKKSTPDINKKNTIFLLYK